MAVFLRYWQRQCFAPPPHFLKILTRIEEIFFDNKTSKNLPKPSTCKKGIFSHFFDLIPIFENFSKKKILKNHFLTKI